MLVTATSLTSGSGATSTSFVTASIAPTANALVLAFIHAKKFGGGSPPVPTITGGGMTTWTQVAYKQGVGDSGHGLVVYRALQASPTSGTATISCSSSNDEMVWAIIEITGVITTGTNGADAIIQPTTNASSSAGTSPSVTLSAFSGTHHATVGGIMFQNTGTATPGSGFTEVNVSPANVSRIATQFRKDNSTNVNWTISSSNWITFGAEINTIPEGGSFIFNMI